MTIALITMLVILAVARRKISWGSLGTGVLLGLVLRSTPIGLELSQVTNGAVDAVGHALWDAFNHVIGGAA